MAKLMRQANTQIAQDKITVAHVGQVKSLRSGVPGKEVQMGEVKKRTRQNYTTESFIEKAIEVHGPDMHGYDEVVYYSSQVKVKILCNFCDRYWMQTPANHLFGKKCTCQRTSKKYTTESFIKKSIAMYGDIFDHSKCVYKGSTSEVTLISKKDNKEFTTLASTHINGLTEYYSQENIDARKKNKRLFKRSFTTEEWIEKSKAIYGPDMFDYSEAVYTGAKEYIILYEKATNKRIYIRAGNHLNHDAHFEKYLGRGAAKVLRRKLRATKVTVHDDNSTEAYIKKSKAIYGPDMFDYSMCQYTGANNFIILTDKYGKEIKRRASSHLCHPKYLLSHKDDECIYQKHYAYHTTKSMKMVFSRIHGDKYIYDDYHFINARAKGIITCREHGIFTQSTMDHKDGHGCPACGAISGPQKLTTEKFIKLVVDKYGPDKYDFTDSIYEGSVTPMEVKCCTHDELFTTTPNNLLLKGPGCNSCSPRGRSRAEQMIFELLTLNNIEFTEQQTFKECFYKNKLRFDFYIPELDTCIEYDGQQHYHAMDFFGGQEAFDSLKIRDGIKTQFCEDNHVYLIRIPYWDEINIKSILEKELYGSTDRTRYRTKASIDG